MARKRYQKGALILRGKRNKVWVGRWREDVLEAGVVKRVLKAEVLGTLVDFPTKRLAQRELDSRLDRVNSRSYRPSNNIKFEEFAEKWKATVLVQHKPSTQHSVKSHLKNQLLPTLTGISVKDITTELLQSCVGTWGTSPKTVQTVKLILQMMWNAAKSWGIVTHNPFDGLRLPRPVKTERRSFTLQEVKQIIEAAQEPYKTFYTLAAETGMRAGELCGLRVCDVDFQHCVVQVRQTIWGGRVQTPKTDRATRTIAISSNVAKGLRGLIEEQMGLQGNRGNTMQLVFQDRNGLPWNANNLVTRQLQPLLRSLGIAPGGLHAFRHASATLMDGADVALKIRQDRLGHSDPALTIGTYTHKIAAEERRFVEDLGQILNSNVPNLAVSEAATA
ncbi:MAG TPA: tyrosine-type recombinase/integrase [Candidatus Angelobacter sp.]|nr:tyrosine-type recombinase/integrase [Candidatus Angelobacter sp.]